jgi:hypothetical protein
MPRSTLGPSASTAIAATVGVSSPTSCRSTSMPVSRSGPVTVSPAGSRDTVHPIRSAITRKTSPGWVVVTGQPGTVTEPPVTAAAARNGVAFDRSGSTCQSRAAIGPCSTRQVSGSASSTVTPASRSICTVMSMWGSDGTGSPSWWTVTPDS